MSTSNEIKNESDTAINKETPNSRKTPSRACKVTKPSSVLANETKTKTKKKVRKISQKSFEVEHTSACVACLQSAPDTFFTSRYKVHADNIKNFGTFFSNLTYGSLCNRCYARWYDNTRRVNRIRRHDESQQTCVVCGAEMKNVNPSQRYRVYEKNIKDLSNFFKKQLSFGWLCGTCFEKRRACKNNTKETESKKRKVTHKQRKTPDNDTKNQSTTSTSTRPTKKIRIEDLGAVNDGIFPGYLNINCIR